MTGRSLTRGEATMAEAVFGAAVRLEGVRLHRGGFGPFAVTLGEHVFLPGHLARADVSQADPFTQALLVHELVHVWQFQTRPLRTVASWAKAVVNGGYGRGLRAYRYVLPLGEYRKLGLEQQASVVEHLFLLRTGSRASAMPPGLKAGDLAFATPFPVKV
jgi:hypothetical protein